MTDDLDSDLSWTDPLCADDVVPLQETPVTNGVARVGDRVQALAKASGEEVDEGHLGSEQSGRILQVAAGFKGRPPFRKRLWVALLVQTDSATPVTAFANEVKVFSSGNG